MNTERNEAIAWLIEYGKAASSLAEYDSHRPEGIWRAYKADVSKAEISRLTTLSWATIDRTVRDMQAKEG